MPEAGSSKSEGVLTKIIVGVATPVLTALALYYFGIGGGGEKKTVQTASVPIAVQSVQPVNDSDLRAKQAELERKIEELSESKKETVQTGIAAIESRRQEAQRSSPPPNPTFPTSMAIGMIHRPAPPTTFMSMATWSRCRNILSRSSPPTGRECCMTDGWILNFTPSR